MEQRDHHTLQNLAIALALGLALMLGSFFRIWGDAGSAAFGGKIIEATLSQPIWGTALFTHLATFVVALIAIHLVLGVVAWMLGLIFWYAWPSTQASVRLYVVGTFALLTILILLANAAWFPKTSLGQPYSRFASTDFLGVSVFEWASIVTGMLIILGLARIASKHAARAQFPRKLVLVTGAGIAAIVSGLFLLPSASGSGQAASPDRPHVILIGLDSLRSDAIAQGETIAVAPKIKDFLQRSTQFSNTLTPLARTFPAWVSILTGRHPHSTGAVVNLFPRNRINEGNTLADLLGTAGYRTVYAIDEVRFSNLDETYGFEQMVSPPIGSADFLLGFFSDTPLSNILVNTSLGALLFPYAHANRAVVNTYDPDSFIEQIERDVEFAAPTFLTVHLTLAHWPYSWSTSAELPQRDGKTDSKAIYEQAVRRLDQQFDDLMQTLHDKGALDNAIVVVLSDHGESLGEIEEAHIPDHLDEQTPYAEVYGHGTNVFADEQYRVVLGMRGYGNVPLSFPQGKVIDAPVSLEDVTPTLVDALGVASSEKFDGISLISLIEPTVSAEPNRFESRIRFTETEFNPPGIALGQAISASALRDASEYYRIDPDTDRILIREEFLGEILANRQYAATKAGEMLALVPSREGPGHHAVFLNGLAGNPEWINNAESLEARPGARELWEALKGKFPAANRPIVPVPGS